VEHVLFIVIGIGVFLLGVRDLCILILCTEQIEAEHTGYRTYYGGGRYGIRKVDVPVFTYTYQGVSFQSQLEQNVPYKKLTENMEHGNIHPIYINSKHPLYFSEKSKTGYDSVLVYGAFHRAGSGYENAIENLQSRTKRQFKPKRYL